MSSSSRSAAVAAGAKVPQDHAVKAEALKEPVTVSLDPSVAGVELTVRVPRELVDSYEAVQAVYAGFSMPVVQELSEGDRDAVLAAARDESGKISNSAVQRILVAALTQAAQGN